MSHQTTVRYIDALGCNFDAPVKDWTKDISDVLFQVNVVQSIMCIIVCKYVM